MRAVLLGIAFAAACAATPLRAPAPQASNDAEALYKKMEAALAAAKKLDVTFTSSTEGPGATKTTGSFSIAPGNNLDMKVEGVSGVKKYSLALSSNGAQMTLTRSEIPPPPVPLPPLPPLPPPKALVSNTALALARGGAWLAQKYADGEYRTAVDAHFTAMERGAPPAPSAETDVAKWHSMANFRMGAAEGGAASVTYDLVATVEKNILLTAVTVWIDSKTHLPVRRQGAIFTLADGKPSDAPLSKWTETYQAKSE